MLETEVRGAVQRHDRISETSGGGVPCRGNQAQLADGTGGGWDMDLVLEAVADEYPFRCIERVGAPLQCSSGGGVPCSEGAHVELNKCMRPADQHGVAGIDERVFSSSGLEHSPERTVGKRRAQGQLRRARRRRARRGELQLRAAQREQGGWTPLRLPRCARPDARYDIWGRTRRRWLSMSRTCNLRRAVLCRGPGLRANH
eukprot:scaffold60268_cov27-Tisochrysis_lutea.AAC.11